MEFNKGDIIIYKFQNNKEEEGEIYGLSDITNCYQVFFKFSLLMSSLFIKILHFNYLQYFQYSN